MAATQRVRPAGREETSPDSSDTAVPHDRQSILPRVAGVPAIGAAIIAVGLAAAGALFDGQSNGELTRFFAACYVAGCVLAAAAVRYRGLFTAAVQPPIILFVIVPVAYILMDPAGGSVKDLLFTAGLPLVNRFPLMLVGTACALTLVGIRIFLARQAARAKPEHGGRVPLTADSGPRARRRPRSGRDIADGVHDEPVIPPRTSGKPAKSARPAPARSATGPQRLAAPEAPVRRPRQARPAPNPRTASPGHPVPNVRYRDRPPLTER